MKLETILQILYSNNMTEVVALAIQIDNNLVSNDKKIGDNIKVEVGKEQLSKMGLQRTADSNDRHSHWNTVLLPVLAYNQYALEKKYCVLVNGELKWVNESENSLTSVEPIPLPVQPVEDQTFG